MPGIVFLQTFRANPVGEHGAGIVRQIHLHVFPIVAAATDLLVVGTNERKDSQPPVLVLLCIYAVSFGSRFLGE
jgi:hypothetical protein